MGFDHNYIKKHTFVFILPSLLIFPNTTCVTNVFVFHEQVRNVNVIIMTNYIDIQVTGVIIDINLIVCVKRVVSDTCTEPEPLTSAQTTKSIDDDTFHHETCKLVEFKHSWR